MIERLSQAHPERASLGDLVSARLTALEPLPHNNGWVGVPPQHLRGRLGALAIMPEIEEALYELKRGEDQVVPVHFPAHYPLPYFRGKRRLIRVSLVDVKPYCFAPVIDAELFVGERSGAAVDTTAMTREQLAGMASDD
jgi:hypothetical protein